jgi:hypothetical protein
MAAEILQAILTENPIENEPHDVESFIFVLAYSVTRRAVLESQRAHEQKITIYRWALDGTSLDQQPAVIFPASVVQSYSDLVSAG